MVIYSDYIRLSLDLHCSSRCRLSIFYRSDIGRDIVVYLSFVGHDIVVYCLIDFIDLTNKPSTYCLVICFCNPQHVVIVLFHYLNHRVRKPKRTRYMSCL